MSVLREGWMQVSGSEWAVVDVGNGKFEGSRFVRGFVRALNEGDVGVSLVRDSRWALAFFKSPEEKTPFYVMPGCQVKGVQLLPGPVTPGFVTTNDPEAKWTYEFAAV